MENTVINFNIYWLIFTSHLQNLIRFSLETLISLSLTEATAAKTHVVDTHSQIRLIFELLCLKKKINKFSILQKDQLVLALYCAVG